MRCSRRERADGSPFELIDQEDYAADVPNLLVFGPQAAVRYVEGPNGLRPARRMRPTCRVRPAS